MKAEKIDIDAIARQAQREVSGKDVDYLTMPRSQLPVRAWNWNVLVEPLRPKDQSAGGIYVPPDAKKAKELTTTIGTIIDVGPTAFTGKTVSGIDMSRFSWELRHPSDLIGVVVSYQRYTGNVYELKNGRRLIMLTESEILGDVPNPDEFVFYYD